VESCGKPIYRWNYFMKHQSIWKSESYKPTEQPFLQCYLIENFISIPTQLYLAEFKPDSMLCILVYSLKGFQHL